MTGLSAEVAYFAMLSVFPGLLAVAAAVTSLSLVVGPDAASEVEATVVSWLETVLTDRASAVVDEVRGLFDRDNSDVFTFAVVAALWSGSRGVDALIRAVVLVANDVDLRPFWRRRLLSLGLLLGTVVATAVSLSMFVVGPLLGGGQAVADAIGAGSAFATGWRWLRLPLVAVALTGWSLVILHVSRPGADRWRDDLPGAVTTTALWLIATAGLRAYLGTLGATNPVLGALGGPLIALLWLYLLAAALLIGAEVAQQVRELRGGDDRLNDLGAAGRP
ncbi:MAG TPA: YhjD/YihY/BrkB family envelope integrity protein [Acidimicrobiales bacterium]|nr:YhjD/YihY/BrkB family envelope integrity protein [Acidimicrobiales bacterium]